MGRGKGLSDAERRMIIEGYDRGVSAVEIGRVLRRSAGTVTGFMCKHRIVMGLPPKEKARKTMIDGAMGVAIKKMVQETSNISLRGIAHKLKTELPGRDNYPSYGTVNTFLRSQGIIKRREVLKPPLTAEQRKARLYFARKWLKNGEDQLGLVLWSDETMIRSDPFTKQVSHWGHKTEPAKVGNRLTGEGVSAMFWGCFSYKGRGELIHVPGKINGEKYLSIVRTEFLPEAQIQRANYGMTPRLMHDNAPVHTCRRVREYLEDTEYEFIDWPAYSPDLKPIENVWAWLKRKLANEYQPATSQAVLIDNVKEIWATLDAEMCARFCGDYKKRLKAVIKARGAHTKY